MSTSTLRTANALAALETRMADLERELAEMRRLLKRLTEPKTEREERAPRRAQRG